MRFATAATVIAPTVKRNLGLNQDAFVATSAATLPFSSGLMLDGTDIVEPNEAVWFAGNIATLAKLAVTLMWVEEDA